MGEKIRHLRGLKQTMVKRLEAKKQSELFFGFDCCLLNWLSNYWNDDNGLMAAAGGK